MSIISSLIGEWLRWPRSFVQRYWLLVYRPDKFWNQAVEKDERRALKTAIIDLAATAAAITTIVSLFLYIPGLKQFLPTLVVSFVSDKLAVLTIIISLSLPSFLIFAIGMKLLRAQLHESLIIYLYCLTLIFLSFGVFIVVSILLDVFALSIFLQAQLIPTNPYQFHPGLLFWMIVMMVVMTTVMGLLFYVPCRLIERSTKCSALIAAILVITATSIPVTASMYGLQLYILRNQSAFEMPPDPEPGEPSK